MSSTALSTLEDDFTIVTTTKTGRPGGLRGFGIPTKNLEPLTTVFTYEASCLGNWTLHEDETLYSTKVDDKHDDGWSACQPLKYQATYSPGLCPSGYSIAKAAMTLLFDTDATFKEWNALCCPSGFKAIVDPLSQCIGSVSTAVGAWVTATFNMNSTDELDPVNTTQRTVMTRTYVSSKAAVVEPLVVMWQSTDLSKFPSAYATALAKRLDVTYTPSTSATPGHLAGLPEATSDISTAPSGPVPGTGLLGIIVGFPVLIVVLIAVLVGFLIRRRRRRIRTACTDKNALPELEDQETKQGRTWFLGGRWRSETDSKPVPGELAASHDPRELCAQNEPGEMDARSERSLVELDGS
ncbi:hypothetical protein DE146DRAFT_736588 [Phaeosphaeria sp. MPI-PUGE-AT-0046c]|nr:hypothetical protein DE146DRAFT_736588 [Phaeosphaeria sp. MPI-PUGE-AT-0046c]